MDYFNITLTFTLIQILSYYHLLCSCVVTRGASNGLQVDRNTIHSAQTRKFSDILICIFIYLLVLSIVCCSECKAKSNNFLRKALRLHVHVNLFTSSDVQK
jgi:hypothetical protein